MASLNERKTELLVEKRLQKQGYDKPGAEIVVERQRSDTPRIQKLLVTASKRGGGAGQPEFIIHSTKCPEFLLVIECKADPGKHASKTLDRYADYALDGALLYASYLSKEFDVLAIAVSGQDDISYRISHHLYLKGASKSVDFDDADDILPLADYYEAFSNSDIKFRQDYESLLDFSRTLNNTLQSKKVTEAERAFLISGVLIGLQSKAFHIGYKSHKSGRQLAASLFSTILGEFENAQLPQDRRENLDLAFSFITKSPALIDDPNFFVKLIDDIDKNINRFRKTHQFYDVVGQFYVEFLRYANNDKGLGIVLTPPHVADVFAEMAGVNKDSVVFDNCCGTGGLLIAAMNRMIQDAGADKTVQQQIKTERLVGIEYQPKIYALAVSNMILHGDGKTNVFRGDCFSDTVSIAGRMQPTVGLLNPPYKNKTQKDDKEELEYVLNNLNSLVKGGTCVAIVPITCATAPKGKIAEWKELILQRHTLEAVVSMPIELFHNSKTNVVTCAMVFTAHHKHPIGKKTWFGYWRDDGFVKTKHRGRVDRNATWPGIKTHWINAFRNREVIEEFSITKEVRHSDEWCAEAYLIPDYTEISELNLKEAAKQYVLCRVSLLKPLDGIDPEKTQDNYEEEGEE